MFSPKLWQLGIVSLHFELVINTNSAGILAGTCMTIVSIFGQTGYLDKRVR